MPGNASPRDLLLGAYCFTLLGEGYGSRRKLRDIMAAGKNMSESQIKFYPKQ